MQRPRPSTVTTLTAVASRSMRYENPSSEASAPAMEATAPTMGIPAATNPPNTTIMTTKLTGSAMPSPVRRSTWSWPVIASMRSCSPAPLTLAWGPAARSGWNAARTAEAIRWWVALSGLPARLTTVANPSPAGRAALEQR